MILGTSNSRHWLVDYLAALRETQTPEVWKALFDGDWRLDGGLLTVVVNDDETRGLSNEDLLDAFVIANTMLGHFSHGTAVLKVDSAFIVGVG